MAPYARVALGKSAKSSSAKYPGLSPKIYDIMISFVKAQRIRVILVSPPLRDDSSDISLWSAPNWMFIPPVEYCARGFPVKKG